MAKKLAAAGIQLLVIDTENKFVSTGFAEEIAKAGQGKYCEWLASWVETDPCPISSCRLHARRSSVV